MVKDNTDPNWTARIITSFAMVLALAGGLWLFDKVNRDTGTPTAIATSAPCDKASGDEAIAACTRAINSGRLRSHDLAVEYYNRGIEYKNRGDVDRAIADYTEAIRLDPRYEHAYINRGNAYNAKGDHDRAGSSILP